MAGTAAALGAAAASSLGAASAAEPLFKISLAEWSVHQALFKRQMQHLEFPAFAKRECGIEAVEFVNQFFKDKARDEKYLAELKQRCDDDGVVCVLIMCDGEGRLGDPDATKRAEAVENHAKWIDAAKFLDCRAIRVNADSEGSREEQAKLNADGLRQLAEKAAPLEINVIVENHGGLSSDGKWVVDVMRRVDLPNCGTLPDFGNFYDYDRYQGVREMMPFAKGVSAKSYGFDEEGNESEIDYQRMLEIVVDAGYRGYVGIEWEGKQPAAEKDGILLTKRLLERVRAELST
jgi:sugar phosphate isomerase/epimerase